MLFKFVCISSCLSGVVEDILIVPVSISYDKVCVEMLGVHVHYGVTVIYDYFYIQLLERDFVRHELTVSCYTLLLLRAFSPLL